MKKIICTFMTFLILLSLAGCKKIDENMPSVLEAESVKTVSFTGVGDNLIHNVIYWQADKLASGDDFDFTPMYELVSDDIKNADLSYINQETILGGSEIGLSSYPLFNSPKELGRDMKKLGFDIFSHATNHVFDKGEKGIKNTYEFYEENPDLTMVGIHKKDEEIIKVVDKNGIKIAFLNYTDITNGLSLSSQSEFYVPVIDYEENFKKLSDEIIKAKKMADFVVLFIHWGNENELDANGVQREAAKKIADLGCDVIIGTHPHVIEPIEYIDDTLVVYSLGNFISAQKGLNNLIGGMIKFDFVVDNTKKRIENVSFVPVVTYYQAHFSNIKIIPLKDYKEHNAHGIGLTYEYASELVKTVIDSKFLDPTL